MVSTQSGDWTEMPMLELQELFEAPGEKGKGKDRGKGSDVVVWNDSELGRPGVAIRRVIALDLITGHTRKRMGVVRVMPSYVCQS